MARIALVSDEPTGPHWITLLDPIREDYDYQRDLANAWIALPRIHLTWLDVGPPCEPRCFQKFWAKWSSGPYDFLLDERSEFAAVARASVAVLPADISNDSLGTLYDSLYGPFTDYHFPDDCVIGVLPWPDLATAVVGGTLDGRSNDVQEFLARLTARMGWYMYQFSLWQELRVCYSQTSRGSHT